MDKKKHESWVTIAVFEAQMEKMQRDIEKLRADAREDRQSIATLAYNNLKHERILRQKQ